MTRDDVLWATLRRLRAERAERCLTYLAETIENWEEYSARHTPDSPGYEQWFKHSCSMADTWMRWYAEAIKPVGPAHS
jgi:hypothetical protein